MGRRNSGSKLGNLLGGVFTLFLVGLTIVGTVAGIKYVVDNDLFGNPTSDPSIITTSDEPTTSEEPITSDEPITSEIPTTSEEPVTSETPPPPSLSGDFPSPLFDGEYSEFLLANQAVIDLNLNPHIKPATISASSYGTHLGTATKGYYRDNLGNTSTAVDFTISANSIRYDNTQLGYKLGFSDSTIASNVTIDPIFYRDQQNTAYTYTSVIIYNFSIVNEGGWSFSLGNSADLPLSIYYRTNDSLSWKIASEPDINYFTVDSYDLLDGVQMQLAVAYHSNSKSNSINPMDIRLRLIPEEMPNEEQIYRIQSKTNFFDEENFGIAWEVINSNVVGQYDTHTGISKDNYYYIDLKKREDFTGFYINIAIYGMQVGGFGNVDAQFLQPGVNLIELTATPEPQYPDMYIFTADIVFSRPFYASDFN